MATSHFNSQMARISDFSILVRTWGRNNAAIVRVPMKSHLPKEKPTWRYVFLNHPRPKLRKRIRVISTRVSHTLFNFHKRPLRISVSNGRYNLEV
jgi:hypothetical protein